jgi:hypothetical protein
MLPAHGEWLTGWAARYDIDRASNGREIKLPRIHLMQRPAIDGMRVVSLIFPECLAGVVIPLDDSGMAETGSGHSNC